MIRSLYTAGTGMRAQETNISVIANNLANVSTVGFKRSRADFEDLLYQTLRVPGTVSESGNQIPTGIQVGLGTKPVAVSKLFSQGDFQLTNNDLDIAIEGKGFFQIQQADGTIAYTRAGSFKLDSNGQIVNPDGLVLEPGITIPTDTILLSIDQQGQVSVTQPGNTTPTVVGTIELASFVNPAGLNAIGDTLFEETEASGTPTTGSPGTNEFGTTLQGFVETSNVSVVEELTQMIIAQRAYEMNSKAIQTSDEMLQTANNTKR